MLVTDVGDQMCWWQVWDVGDRFIMLVTYLIHWENHQHNEKSRQHNESATNISNQSPSWSHQHNDVTNITVTHAAVSILARSQIVLKQLIPRYFNKNLESRTWIFRLKYFRNSPSSKFSSIILEIFLENNSRNRSASKYSNYITVS